MKKVKIKQGKAELPKEAELSATKVIDMHEFITECQGEYDKAVNARAEFVNNQLKWFKKRYGIRPKKTFPWPGASNMHIPLTDKTIRKMKPDYVWTLWNTVPMCSMQAVGPEDMDLADRAEWHTDWLLRTRMKIFPEICLAADKMLGKGFCIAKVIYKRDYEPVTKILLRKELTEYSNILDLTDPNNLESFITILSQKFNFDAQDEKDRKKLQDITQAIYNNAEAVEFTVDDPCYDAPLLSIYNPEDIVVPADTISVFDLEKARFIDHVYLISPEDFLKDKLLGKWDGHEEVADNILRLHGIDVDDLKDKKEVAATRKEKPIEQMEKRRTGNASKDDMIEIHERCMWFDSDNDGLAERHILNYCEEDMTDCLRFIKYPLGKKWPYVKIPFEFSGDNHDNPRGIPELLSTINASMNIQHNSKINRQTLSTALMFWYVPGEVNSDNVRFIPGQGIPVKAPGNQNFGIVQVPDVGYSFEKEEQILKAYAEEYIGTTDFGMASAVNPTGTGKARTATELEQIKMSAAGTRRLDILIWKMAWAEIFDRIFTQWVTMGPAEVWSAIDGTGKPAELTPSELDYHFNIVPAGDITTSDPEVELEKARQRAQMFAGNKYIRQYNLTKEMLSKDDPRVMKSLLVTQQEAQMIDQAEAQAQQTMQKMEMIKLLQGGKGANAKGSGAGRKAPAAAKT